MTLVCEPDLERPALVRTRIVLDVGEPPPRSVDDVRSMLQRAIAALPKQVGGMVVARLPDVGREERQWGG